MKLPDIPILTCLLFFGWLVQPAAAALPPEVQQDKHHLLFNKHLQAGHYQKALVNLEKYRRAGGEPTPEMLYQEGFALVQVGRTAEAEQALTGYLEQTGQQGEHYREALRMLIDIEGESEATVGKRAYDAAAFRDPLRSGGFGPEMLFVRPGCFYLTQPNEKFTESGEKNRKRVCLDAYAVATREISFADYGRFAAATGRALPADEGWGKGDRPVINVTYRDAEAYAGWLSAETGKTYRLPTEAEWEYAARAGTDTLYWWGDEVETGHANCDGCGSRWDNRQSAPVGSFAANEWGLYDTAGNVAEWTCSEMAERFDGSEQRCGGEIKGNSRRVVRGGSWYLRPTHARPEARSWGIPQAPQDDVGLRVVLIP